MNKLLVVEDKKLDSGEFNLDIKKDISITIENDVIIHDINNDNRKINIIINKDSKLKLYIVKELISDYDIHITLLNKAFLEFNMLLINKDNNQVKINIEMTQDKAKSVINIRGINKEYNSNLDIICNGYIKENTKDNELIENMKGLIIHNNDTIKISPIMIIDTNEVSANHLVTIGSFREEELFDLQSKGLSETLAKELLINSFLKGNMEELELEFLKLGGDNFE